MSTMKKKFKTVEEFDKYSEENDITEYIDESSIKFHRPTKRVNVDFTLEILKKIDNEASKIGIARTALIKMLIAQHFMKR
ncbi:MAG: CopG family antitoxin [Candidatus Margulisbacteria bacterium]|nr:CopG family antitoxin [Candidatus Margulisiibacteriota bacterium]